VKVHSRSGHRRIDRIRRSGNTSRILDLITCGKNLSEPASGSEQTTDTQSPENQRTTRFFHSERLNRAIFLKHNLRDDERSLFLKPAHVETKILLPIDSGRLDIGARSFFIRERTYDRIMRDVLHMDPDAEDETTRRDLKVLDLLWSIPSFDPFILCEALRLAGITIDRRYFSASYDQIKVTTEAVYSDFKPLIESALGKSATNEQLGRFIDQVWNVTEATTSNLFFDTLRIPRTEWLDIVFAWKALLFYRLEAKGVDKRLSNLITAMKKLQINNNANMCSRAELRRLERDLVQRLFQLQKRFVTYLDDASQGLVHALSVNFDAVIFRETLRKLSTNIAVLGTDITVFTQVASYYMHLYGRRDCYVDGGAYETTLRSLDEIVSLRFAN
jgi:hypothetical protein